MVILNTLIFINITINAETLDENSDSKMELYETTTPFTYNNLLFETGTLLYGEFDAVSQQVTVNFDRTDIVIPKKNLKLVDTSSIEYIPDFEEVNVEEINIEEAITIIEPTTYELQSVVNVNKVKMLQSFETTVYTSDGDDFILIGNIKYTLGILETINKDSEVNRKIEESVEYPLENKTSEEQKTLSINTITYSAGFFKVTDESVPVYDYSVSPRVKVGELKKGQEYKITGDSGNWHKIQFGSIEGFVWKESTIPSTGQEIKNLNHEFQSSNHNVITKGNVIVYDNSNGGLEAFAVISNNVKYPIVADTGNWLQILFGDRIGYIYKSNVDVVLDFDTTGFFKVADDNVPVYDYSVSPRVKAGELKKGQEYKITGDSGNWHKIQFGSIEGFVWKEFTIASTGQEIKNLNKDYQNSKLTFITKGNLIVYDNTSNTLEPFGVISEGVKYPVVDDTGNWLRVLFGDRVGYVYKSSVQMGFKESDRSFKVLTNNVPIYHNINGILEKVGYLVEDQAYLRTGSKGNWHIINFGNSSGYVWMDSTIPDSARSVTNFNPGLINSNNNYIAQDDLVIRDESNGMEIFARISKGTVYPIVKQVGSWYQVLVGGRVGYVYYSGFSQNSVEYRNYNISLAAAVEKQMAFRPQTTHYEYAYVHKDWIDGYSGTFPFEGKVTATSLHVRDIPNGNSYGLLSVNTKVNVVGISSMDNQWYKIENPLDPYAQFVNADKDLVTYYMDPNNFIGNEIQKYQFLELDKFTNTSITELEKLLKGRGVLEGKASIFSNSAKSVGINEVYLISHALLETGNGTSQLASGVGVIILKDEKGNPVIENGKTKIRIAKASERPDSVVYNLFGIGAYDNCALLCGAEYAYNAGWTTVDKAVVGGAEFISSGYIRNDYYRQNTLYDMKWNPRYLSGEIPDIHQYATDIGWATKQVTRIYNLYSLLEVYNLYLKVPKYQ